MSEWINTDTPTVENVFLLTVDSLRADHLSCYGYERGTTPNLDRFATEGVLFERAYSTSSHTRESVPSLLTGEYPDRAVDNGFHLSAPSVATHLGDDVTTAAFHSNPYVSRAYDFDRDFDAFDDDLPLRGGKIISLLRLAWARFRGRFYARGEEINERSLDWVDGQDGPVFIWNHYMDPHDPYEPPVKARRDLGVDGPEEIRSLHRRAGQDPASVSKEEHRHLVNLYDGEVRYIDTVLGEFLDALEERGLRERSLVLVTADHGDAFGEHGYYGHPRRLHDELVHVPLLVAGPGFGKGERVEAPVGTIDVPATVLCAFGADPSLANRRPLQAVAANPGGCADRGVVSQASGEDDRQHVYRFTARNGEETVHLERHLGTGEVLSIEHHLASGEVRALEEDETKSLVVELKAHSRAHLPSEARATGEEDVSGEVERRLQALGYHDE